jgi:hypothetical protein
MREEVAGVTEVLWLGVLVLVVRCYGFFYFMFSHLEPRFSHQL